jgi:hypothetical protein
VIVGRQDLGNPFPSQSLHRNAVSQAVSLVGARILEIKAVKKTLMRLVNNHHLRILKRFVNGTCRDISHGRAVAAVMGEEFVKYFFRGDEHHWTKQTHRVNNMGMPLILAIRKGDPVHRVGKHSSHEVTGRFGVP